MLRARELLHGSGGRLGIALVEAYRLALGAQLGGACRFEPSCSAYAAECFARHGLIAGAGLAASRLWRCRPGSAGGFDPVP